MEKTNKPTTTTTKKKTNSISKKLNEIQTLHNSKIAEYQTEIENSENSKKKKARKTGNIKAKLKINSIFCIRNYSRQNAMKEYL